MYVMYNREDAVEEVFYSSEKLASIVKSFEDTIRNYAKKGKTSCKIEFSSMNFTEDEIKYLLNEMECVRQFYTTHKVKDEKHIFEFKWL